MAVLLVLALFLSVLSSCFVGIMVVIVPIVGVVVCVIGGVDHVRGSVALVVLLPLLAYSNWWCAQ